MKALLFKLLIIGLLAATTSYAQEGNEEELSLEQLEGVEDPRSSPDASPDSLEAPELTEDSTEQNLESDLNDAPELEPDFEMDVDFESEQRVESVEDSKEIFDQVDKMNEISSIGGLKSFVYSERGRRDPFKKPGGVEEEIKIEVPVNIKSGLEGYDIESFELTGVMWDIKYPKAMVRAGNNETFVVEEGTKIGRKNGYVARIREGEVIIVEPTNERSVGKTKKEKTLYKTQVLKLGR